MDETTLLTEHRPEPEPPTDAERDALRTALLAHITASTGDSVVDLTASPRRNRRTLRRAAALVGAAAALVVGFTVAGGSETTPAPLRDRPATAAEQLQAIADEVAADPDGPYSIARRTVVAFEGGGETRTVTRDIVMHRAAPDVRITEDDSCVPDVCAGSGPLYEVPPFGADDDAATVRAAIDAEVRRLTVDPAPGPVPAEWVGQVRAGLVGSLLQDATLGPQARAEMLRMLAEIPGITSTPDQQDQDGRTGTLFRFVTARGDETSFLIDPADGYVLETGEVRLSDRMFFDDPDAEPPTAEDYFPSDYYGIVEPEGPLVYRSTATTTFARPTTDPLPEAVVALSEALTEAGPWVDPVSGTSPQCFAGVGPTEGNDVMDVAVPAGLQYLYCPET